MFAKASKIDWPLFTGADGAGAGAPTPSEANASLGGLPGGVVETSTKVRSDMQVVAKCFRRIQEDIRGGPGALSFSLKDSSKDAQKVEPFSQISISFFSFSYIAQSCE